MPIPRPTSAQSATDMLFEACFVGNEVQDFNIANIVELMIGEDLNNAERELVIERWLELHRSVHTIRSDQE